MSFSQKTAKSKNWPDQKIKTKSNDNAAKL